MHVRYVLLDNETDMSWQRHDILSFNSIVLDITLVVQRRYSCFFFMFIYSMYFQSTVHTDENITYIVAFDTFTYEEKFDLTALSDVLDYHILLYHLALN